MNIQVQIVGYAQIVLMGILLGSLPTAAVAIRECLTVHPQAVHQVDIPPTPPPPHREQNCTHPWKHYLPRYVVCNDGFSW